MCTAEKITAVRPNRVLFAVAVLWPLMRSAVECGQTHMRAIDLRNVFTIAGGGGACAICIPVLASERSDLRGPRIEMRSMPGRAGHVNGLPCFVYVCACSFYRPVPTLYAVSTHTWRPCRRMPSMECVCVGRRRRVCIIFGGPQCDFVLFVLGHVLPVNSYYYR